MKFRSPAARRRAIAALPLIMALPLLLALAPLLPSCADNAPTSPYTPITGVQILAANVTAGHGCGTGPNQVFQYVALVGCLEPDGGALAPACTLPDGGVANTQFFASDVSDCFSDMVFSNLPIPSNNEAFVFQVYAFNQSSFLAFEDGGLDCPSDPDAACPGQDASVVQQALPLANWMLTCTATQVPGATIVASCSAPLATGDAGDAGAVGDAGVVGDAGDAGQSAGDAGDASDADTAE